MLDTREDFIMLKRLELDNVANNLRNIIIEADITQAELARRCGFTESWVSLLVNGKRTPRFDTINVLAQALDVPVQRILDSWVVKGKWYKWRGVAVQYLGSGYAVDANNVLHRVKEKELSCG